MERRPFTMTFPFPPRDTVRFFREYFGATRVAYSRLDEAAQAAYTSDVEKLWEERNQSKDGTTYVTNEYLEIVATRA
jgi:hypothetical protein